MSAEVEKFFQQTLHKFWRLDDNNIHRKTSLRLYWVHSFPVYAQGGHFCDNMVLSFTDALFSLPIRNTLHLLIELDIAAVPLCRDFAL